MKRSLPLVLGLVGCLVNFAQAQNWPQWRGPNRDAKVTGFKAPASWPKELSQKWKISVGDGVATPALVGDKLYVFARQEGNEIIRCMDAATGSEIWSDKYPTDPVVGNAAGFQGPRASPTVADGKVITLGVRGVLSCHNATTGEKLWRKDDNLAWPQFFTSSSPLVVDQLCIAQFGSSRQGGIAAYDLTTGEEKWKWTGDGPAYASPSLLDIDGAKAIVAVTANKLVAIGLDGNPLWQTSYTQGRYNATSPIVKGQTVIYAGPTRGMTAVSFEKHGDELAKKEEGGWKNEDNSLMFNTPLLRDGSLYGISGLNALFCVNADTGESQWSAPLGQQAAAAAPPAAPPGEKKADDSGEKKSEVAADQKSGDQKTADQKDQKADDKKGPGGFGGPGMKGGKGMKGGMRGGMGGGGYGSVVDAGTVLVAQIPSGQLVVFEPNDKEFKQIASYKVADSDAYAYPILSGNRIFVKDKYSVILWTVE